MSIDRMGADLAHLSRFRDFFKSPQPHRVDCINASDPQRPKLTLLASLTHGVGRRHVQSVSGDRAWPEVACHVSSERGTRKRFRAELVKPEVPPCSCGSLSSCR